MTIYVVNDNNQTPSYQAPVLTRGRGKAKEQSHGASEVYFVCHPVPV